MESAAHRAHFLVNLLEEDPELGDAAQLDKAPARTRALAIARGPWDPDVETHGLGLLILSGFLTRRVELAGRHSLELLGPGDLIRSREVAEDEYAMVPSRASWRVIEEVELALLDAQFADWASGQPILVDRLLSRLLRRSRTLALRLALVQLPRLSSRLHFLLWHLSDRFGRVQKDGVLLSVPLSHSMLADLVSAQRPPVARAMKDLERHGLILPASGGGWYLRGRPPTALGPNAPLA